MQDAVCELPRIHLLGTWVNKGPESYRPRSFWYGALRVRSAATLAPGRIALAHPLLKLLIGAAPVNAPQGLPVLIVQR